MMDRLQSYVLHGFPPRLFSAGVVTVWRRNIEVWWIIFRPKNISFHSFILTQARDSYSYLSLLTDTGFWRLCCLLVLASLTCFPSLKISFCQTWLKERPRTYFVMEYASPRIIKQRIRVTPPKTPEMM